MLVTDQVNHRIMCWSPGEKDGHVAAGGNGKGIALHQLDEPRGLAVDNENQIIYVADTGNHRVMKWEFGGTTGTIAAGGNDAGTGLHQLHGPRCLLLEDDGNLLIGDNYNHRVMRWTPGAPKGQVVAGGHGTGHRLDQLSWPYGLTLDAANSLYISDHLNARVMKWAPGAKEGEVVAGGQGKGDAMNQLFAPCGLVFDSHGRLLVADAGNHRILRYASIEKDGKAAPSNGEVVAGCHEAGKGLHQLSWPFSIRLDKQGRLLIADLFNHRVLRWAPGQPEGQVVAGGNGIGDGLHQL